MAVEINAFNYGFLQTGNDTLKTGKNQSRFGPAARGKNVDLNKMLARNGIGGVKGLQQSMAILKATYDFGKRAAAVVLIGLVLLLTLAGTSPSLHHAIHSDAGSPDHQCVVKLFSQGQVDAADAAPAMAVPVQLFAGVDLPAETFSLPSADYRFSSSRAPPCAVLLPS